MASVDPPDTTKRLNDGISNELKSNTEEGFVLVKNSCELEPILKSRLPDSAHVLNAVKLGTKWGSDYYQYYAQGLENPSTAWIAVKVQCSAFGVEIMISRPQELPIPAHMREFIKCAPFMNWDEAYAFAAVDQGVSSLVEDIAIRDYGNQTLVLSGNLFHLEIEEAMKLNPTLTPEGAAQIIPLSSDQGTEFIMKVWKYATEKNAPYVERVLKMNPSFGVLEAGKIVSGVGLASNGLIGMLNTLKEARGKGYAKATMHSMMKAVAEQCIIPACTAQIRNLTSRSLQKKLGFKEGPKVGYVIFLNPDYD